MRLAEALQIRSDLSKRLAQMPGRMENNAKTQEGVAPAEAPAALIKELDGICADLEDIIVRINLTNATARDERGRTITELIAHRDVMKERVDAMRTLLNSASKLITRYQSTDIKVIPTVDVTALRSKCDAMSKEIRETEVAIQGLNWTTELVERK